MTLGVSPLGRPNTRRSRAPRNGSRWRAHGDGGTQEPNKNSLDNQVRPLTADRSTPRNEEQKSSLDGAVRPPRPASGGGGDLPIIGEWRSPCRRGRRDSLPGSDGIRVLQERALWQAYRGVAMSVPPAASQLAA